MVFDLSLRAGLELIVPLALFILGIAVYSLFIFKFYKFLAKKDIFELDLYKSAYSEHPGLKNFFMVCLYILEYLLIFPLFTIFWGAFLTVLLIFLSQEQSIATVLLVSMALVGAIRATAYYDEDLSKDLSKMLPFALLGVFLVSVEHFSFTESIAKLMTIGGELNTILYYIIFAVVLELILRLMTGLTNNEKKYESIMP